MTQEEAEQYLSSFGWSQELGKTTQTLTTPQIQSIDEDYTIRQNERIIRAADDILLDRMENWDTSLRLTDVISAKESAFKQNRVLSGHDDEKDQLIPSVINIAVINN